MVVLCGCWWQAVTRWGVSPNLAWHATGNGDKKSSWHQNHPFIPFRIIEWRKTSCVSFVANFINRHKGSQIAQFLYIFLHCGWGEIWTNFTHFLVPRTRIWRKKATILSIKLVSQEHAGLARRRHQAWFSKWLLLEQSGAKPGTLPTAPTPLRIGRWLSPICWVVSSKTTGSPPGGRGGRHTFTTSQSCALPGLSA